MTRSDLEESIGMKCKRFVTAVFFLALIAWTPGGCTRGAADRGAVRGKVTVDGSPLPEGSIEFIPMDPRQGQTGSTGIKNGEYAIAAQGGLLPGEYQVQIRAERRTGKKHWDGMGDERRPASQKNYVEEMESYIPAKYNDRSTFKAKVEPGKVNEFNYNLEVGKK
jgi:hypothetical protein